MTTSSALCVCGHPAYQHASAEQITARLAATSGQFSVHCKGGDFWAPLCRCTHSREDVAS